jgi:hypothetical protein
MSIPSLPSPSYRAAGEMTEEQVEWAESFIGKMVKHCASGKRSKAVSYSEGSHHGGIWVQMKNGKETFFSYPAHLQVQVLRGRSIV